MILDDLEGNFSCLKSFLLSYHGNVACLFAKTSSRRNHNAYKWLLYCMFMVAEGHLKVACSGVYYKSGNDSQLVEDIAL